MGVRGLTTFISNRSHLYLERYELHDTYLVIDGNCISSQLYDKVSESFSAFGGDYDEYYKVVYEFFIALKKCGVTPIVIFDGGHERRKVRTVYKRLVDKLMLLKIRFANSFSKTKFFPLFMKLTFWDVASDLGITCVQSNFEADNEIAAVARCLNCPVLSFDSDFYIYNVLYIPFSTFSLIPLKSTDPNSLSKFYLSCSIYDVNNFLKQFSGLNSSLLPVLAVLLGNDFVNGSLFSKFFNHVSMPKGKNLSTSEKKICAVLHWLENETYETAVPHIVRLLSKECEETFLKAVDMSVKDYTSTSSSLAGILDLKQLESSEKVENADVLIRLPKELQVQEVRQLSPHEASFPVISAMDKLLCTSIGKCDSLKLYFVRNCRLINEFAQDNSKILPDVNLEELINSSKEIKQKAVISVLRITDEDVDNLNDLPDNLILYFIAFIYFVKKFKSSLTPMHCHALLLTMFAGQIVESQIGYYKLYETLMRRKSVVLKLLESKNSDELSNVTQKFSSLLSKSKKDEMFDLAKIFAPFREASDGAKGKSYNISTIHFFATFQSCLYHLTQFNALLNFPFVHPKISELYSGTLLYNLYLNLKKSSDCIVFIDKMLKATPITLELYNYLYSKLKMYFPNSNIIKEGNRGVRKVRKGKKKRVVVTLDNGQEGDFVPPSEDEYFDVNNPYYLLQGK